MKELNKSEYKIIKRVLHQNNIDLVFTFLGKSDNELYNPNNPEQKKYTVGWEFKPERIKQLLLRYGVEELTGDLKIAYRVVYEDTLYEIKKLVSKSQYKELLKYMDDYIDVSVYSCINIDAFLNKIW